MKKKSVLKVVLATILVVALCTWIFPSASFSTSLVEGERAQIGLFDLFSYPMVALTYFGYVVVYTLAIGMFYGVANKIPAYHALIEKLQKLYVGKEWLFLSIVIVLISAIVSVSGLSFGMIFVFPFIISVILKMGYNKLVAASVTVGSVIAGMAGTTLGSTTVNYMNQLLGTDIFGEMVSKIVILVAFMIILIANILMYAKKTKNNTLEVSVSAKKEESKKEVKDSKVSKKQETKKVEKKEVSKKNASTKTSKKEKETKSSSAKKKTTSKKTTKTKAAMAKNDSEVIRVKEKKEKKVRVWPFVLLFDLMIILLAISVFDFAGLFEIKLFTDVTAAVTEFEILGFPIFGKILGVVNEFGAWSLNVELPVVIVLATLFLALIYRVKWSDLCDGIEDGVKKAVKPSIAMLLAYVVLIIVTYHPFQLVITKFLLDLTSGLNVVTMAVAAMVSSIFNVDPIYVAQSTIPYVMSVITDSSLYPLIGVIFQAIYGLMMLVAPTSIILVGTLSYLDIPYGQWLKHIWKIFVELLVVLLVIFLIILAI